MISDKNTNNKNKISQGRQNGELKTLKNLGSQETSYHTTYNPGILEKFENKNPQAFAWTTFICTEFTSLCPKTNQPDFAKIYVNYIADKWMVESKSMKLYLFSFRNHGDFHEDCVQKIANDLNNLLKPKYLEVIGEFTPRGGIAIFPYSSHASPLAKDKEYQELKRQRMIHYAPGRYTMDLAKLY